MPFSLSLTLCKRPTIPPPLTSTHSQPSYTISHEHWSLPPPELTPTGLNEDLCSHGGNDPCCVCHNPIGRAAICARERIYKYDREKGEKQWFGARIWKKWKGVVEERFYEKGEDENEKAEEKEEVSGGGIENPFSDKFACGEECECKGNCEGEEEKGDHGEPRTCRAWISRCFVSLQRGWSCSREARRTLVSEKNRS